VLRRFGLLAGACVAVLVLSGLVMTGHLVATPNALVSSWYGRSLLVKLGIGLLVGLLGLLNTMLLRPQVAVRMFGPRARTGWVRATVSAEAVLMLALLLAVGVLTSSQPANGPRWASPDGSGPLLAGQADDLVESFSVSPNRPGQTFVNVAVFNSRRPAPGVIDRVDVRMRGPQGQRVTRSAILGDPSGVSVAGSTSGANEVPAAYVVAGGDINTPGRWQFDVVVHRPGLPDATATYDWTVTDPQAAGRPQRLPSTPLAPVLDGLATAGLLLLLALGAGVAVGVSRHRRVRAEPPDGELVDAGQASSSDAPR
jgi:copper transport protein